MYSFGEEFTYTVDDSLEYFTCLHSIEYDDKEYIITENEYGIKKVFEVDEDEEELYMIDEDEEDTILDIYERHQFENEHPDIEYGFDNEEDEYVESNDTDGLSVIMDEDEEDEEEKMSEQNYENDEIFSDMDDFLDDFFEDEE